jgi:hypothetical protein
MIVTANKGPEALCDPQLFLVLIPSITEALANPVCRLELLQWLVLHLSSSANLKSNEYNEFVVSLVVVMQVRVMRHP